MFLDCRRLYNTFSLIRQIQNPPNFSYMAFIEYPPCDDVLGANNFWKALISSHLITILPFPLRDKEAEVKTKRERESCRSASVIKNDSMTEKKKERRAMQKGALELS